MPASLPGLFKRLKSTVGRHVHDLRRHCSRKQVQAPDGRVAATVFCNPDEAHFLIDAYLERPGPHPVRTLPCLPVAGLIRRLAREHGLVLFKDRHIPRSLRPHLLEIPRTIGMACEITGSLAETRAALPVRTRNNLCNIEARGLRVELSRDPGLLPEFHSRHFTPAMRARHGSQISLPSLDSLQQTLRNGGGELWRVFDGDRWIAALFASADTDGYRLRQFGWLDGDPGIVSKGALKLLYWRGITRTIELGLPRTHFGGCPNDLNDGILFQKTRWGGRVVRTGDLYPKWSILINPEHPAIRDYLSRHTPLFLDNEGGHYVLSTRLPSEIPASSSQSTVLSAWYRLRDTPVPIRHTETTSLRHLPASLRPWFDSVPLPRTKH